jgi:methionine aminotransferase
MPGVPAFREMLAHKIETLYGVKVSADTEITVTPGATYALYTAFATILHPGDEALVLEPAYDSYIPNIELNGAKAVPLPLTYPDYKIDWEQVRHALNERTKAIIINSPHNPTGSVLDANDIAQLKELVRDTGLFIISDEVYEHLIFDGKQHESILRHPDLLERSFVCFSFGKTYHCTGWKLGYCIAPAALTKEFRKVHQFNAFTCFTPAQVALATYLKNKEAYLSLPQFMQEKRDYFVQGMQQSRFDLLPSSGSYFVCAGYNRISNESDRDFAIRLTREVGVAAIPVSSFYQNGDDHRVIRFCFSKEQRTLEQALERLVRM